ncbi:MAG: hypothetical protein E3J21_06565 [Anaerolineales bacterium]|nr:MAG: hypothetical protein E3J21_06565 [Anaerolineales bacterium]
MAVYKDLAEANAQAVESAHHTLNLILVLAGIIGSILTATGIGAVVSAKEANRLAKEANQLAKEANQLAKEASQLTTQVSTNLQALDLGKKQMQQDLEKVLNQSLDKIQQLERLQMELRDQINSDAEILTRLHALAEVDRYAMGFFGDDTMRRKAAKKGLLQLSKNPDPIIRRECLCVFAVMPDYLEDWFDEEIAAQIEHMVEKDKERGVRKEAEATKRKWQRLRGRRLRN